LDDHVQVLLFWRRRRRRSSTTVTLLLTYSIPDRLSIPFQELFSAVVNDLHQSGFVPHVITPGRTAEGKAIKWWVPAEVVNDAAVARVHEDLIDKNKKATVRKTSFLGTIPCRMQT